jgi:hypothetical protein
VKCVAATRADYTEFEVTLEVRVEGPNDPVALSLAAEKVQHYLDANLPITARRTVTRTHASAAR